jgi:uncharacterized repeat protein (TIGR04138 family)
MQHPTDIMATIRVIAAERGVYRPEAYIFVLEALQKVMDDAGERRHVSGGDLLDGIKQLGRERYGLMATDVFAAWGVNATLDFGRIVFHLVEEKLLSKRDEDSLGDFIDRYDFHQVFELDYFQGKA